MKIAVIIVRSLIGLLYIFSSVVVLFKLVPQPELTGNVKVFTEGIVASVYLFPLIKITELVCGIALLINRFAPLATVIIFPVTLNIFLYHLFLAPEGTLVGILLLLGNLFLAYAYRKNYVGLVAAKKIE